MLKNVACVVVHHRNYPGILTTLDAILAGGVPAEQVILVDNSEDSNVARRLAAGIPIGVQLLHQANSGYGHAVNVGVAALLARSFRPEYILVSTHETIPEVDAISTMVHTLCSSRADAVGPTLIDGKNSGGVIWSTGGELSRILNIPVHTRVASTGRYTSLDWVEREWLDGAFCLYRTDVFDNFEFREEYFLYFEEVDLHMQILRAGGHVVWAPTARVSQLSSGIPSYYLTRNMHLFQMWHGSAIQRAFAPVYSMLRLAMRVSLKEERIPDLRDAWRGYFDGRRLVSSKDPKTIGRFRLNQSRPK